MSKSNQSGMDVKNAFSRLEDAVDVVEKRKEDLEEVLAPRLEEIGDFIAAEFGMSREEEEDGEALITFFESSVEDWREIFINEEDFAVYLNDGSLMTQWFDTLGCKGITIPFEWVVGNYEEDIRERIKKSKRTTPKAAKKAANKLTAAEARAIYKAAREGSWRPK